MTYFTDFTDKAGGMVCLYSHKTRRVISSVFEVFEALVEEGFRIVFANCGHDSAHKKKGLLGL